MGARLPWNGVDRTLGRSGDESQHLKAVPAEDALGRRELHFAPVAIDGRTVSAAFDLDAGEHAPHRRRQRRAPFRHADRAAGIGDTCKRMRENDARIGEETAPVAGMMAALA